MEWIQGNQRRRCQFCGKYVTVGVLSPEYIAFICKVCVDKAHALIPIEPQLMDVLPKGKVDPPTGNQQQRCQFCGQRKTAGILSPELLFICSDCLREGSAHFLVEPQHGPLTPTSLCDQCGQAEATKCMKTGRYLCDACALDEQFMDQE